MHSALIAHNVAMTLPEFMKLECLTDEAAASLFGYDRTTISKFRRGLMIPSYDRMLQIRDTSDGRITLDSWARLKPKQGQAA